jgi:site-specific recombinase XerD
MHQVVENVHGWLQQQMQKWLEGQEDEKLDVEECKQVLEKLFYDQYKREWIQKNVSSLKETYEAIVLAEGGYPTAKHR